MCLNIIRFNHINLYAELGFALERDTARRCCLLLLTILDFMAKRASFLDY